VLHEKARLYTGQPMIKYALRIGQPADCKPTQGLLRVGAVGRYSAKRHEGHVRGQPHRLLLGGVVAEQSSYRGREEELQKIIVVR
jgi:hypothetical protein